MSWLYDAHAETKMEASVRLSVELGELDAYIRGVRFASGEAPPWE
jgi:hypothetical protein